MKDINQTLEDIINRLERIESAIGLKAMTSHPAYAASDTAIADGEPNPFLVGYTEGGTSNAGERKPSLSSATADVPSIARVLGLGGGLALVSAGGYVIKLCIDSGWLTPERQVMMVAIAGIALMFSGFLFPKIDRKYSTALPVTGLILNYLAIAGACSYYHLINEGLAVALVMGATILGLFVSQTFNSVMLSYLAIVGIYSAPVAFNNAFVSNTVLASYCLIWGAAFCAQAIVIKRRSVYLTALFLGLLNFHRAKIGAGVEATIYFEIAQALIFGFGVLLFSLKTGRPMTAVEGYAHVPAVIFYYFFQADLASILGGKYQLLIPAATLAIVFGIFRAAEGLLKTESKVGALMVSTLGGLLLLHATQLLANYEEVCYLGLGVLPLLAGASRLKFNFSKYWPLVAALGVICLVGAYNATTIRVLPWWPAVSFAVEFYALFFAIQKRLKFPALAVMLLYAFHIYAMSAISVAVRHEILTSVAWGLLAVGWFAYAKITDSTKVAQPSLILYSAAGFKLIVLDLGNSEPVVKIMALVVVGAAFFVGGWLYQRIGRPGPA